MLKANSSKDQLIQPKNFGWQPLSENHEFHIADQIVWYSNTPMAYCLEHVLRAMNLIPHEVMEFAQKNPASYLADAIGMAEAVIKNNQDTAYGFFEAGWRKTQGHFYREVHIKHTEIDDWVIYEPEALIYRSYDA